MRNGSGVLDRPKDSVTLAAALFSAVDFSDHHAA
jgi:hypothetical protein